VIPVLSQDLSSMLCHAVLVLCNVMLCCGVLWCAVLCCAVLCCAVLCCAVLCCAVLCCAGEHLVVPLLCLSGVVPSPAGEGGPGNGRLLINLDLTNAQPAAGDVTTPFWGGGGGRGHLQPLWGQV